MWKANGRTDGWRTLTHDKSSHGLWPGELKRWSTLPPLSTKQTLISHLYTTIPHFKLKGKLRELVQLCFIKNYFVKHHSDSTKKFSETDIFNMLEFLIDNIFVMLGGRVFQQTVSIPMDTNCAPLLADLFLYSYEADFIQELLKKNEKKLAWSFNFMFCYIDDVLSLNNFRFGNFVDRIYPIELENKGYHRYR